MKICFKKMHIVFFFFCSLLFFIPTSYAADSTEEKTTTIELNKFYILERGDSLSILSELSSDSFSYENLQFKTSNKKIAKITKRGIVTGKKVGTAKITIRTKDTNELIASTKIYVGKLITRVRLNTTKKKIFQGNYFMLKASVIPTTAAYKKLQYTSSDSNIASVSSKGKVVGIQPGTATITVSTLDGSNISKTCIVTVLSTIQDESDNTDSTFPNPFFQNSKSELQGMNDEFESNK